VSLVGSLECFQVAVFVYDDPQGPLTCAHAGFCNVTSSHMHEHLFGWFFSPRGSGWRGTPHEGKYL